MVTIEQLKEEMSPDIKCVLDKVKVDLGGEYHTILCLKLCGCTALEIQRETRSTAMRVTWKLRKCIEYIKETFTIEELRSLLTDII
jgi:hypothetical protein